MTTERLMSLTPEQTERMASFAQEWIAKGHRTTPLTEDEWALWEQGARGCYEAAGIPWPGVVVRVGSPIVGAFAAPIAHHVIQHLRGRRGAVDDAVRGAVGDAVDGAVGGAVGDAVDDAVGDAVDGAVRGAVGGAVRGAVDDAVGGAVDGAVGGAVDDAVRGAVRDAVRGAVRGAVGDAVGGAVDDAVRGAVRGAVDDAVRDAVRNNYHRYFGGTISAGYWSSWWKSYLAYFRDVVELQLPDPTLWDKFTAFEQAETAGVWWPFRDFVMVCDVPTQIHIEQVAPTGWGSHRLHCETGPAVAWADGWGVYAWHGTRVPADLIIEGWSTDRILREPNAEIRRCAIERMGWDQFITEAGLVQVGETEPDPGNPGHTLALFDVPAAIYDEPIRVLLCTNATVERDGTRRRFGLTVPAHIQTPVEASAWSFDVPVDTYRALQRAS